MLEFIVYFVCLGVCFLMNMNLYDKVLIKSGRKRLCGLISYFILVFLGPLSVLINLYFIGLSLKIRTFKYIQRKKDEKKLEKMIETKFYEALKREGIQVQD